uniref:MSP domain-containing protein n=1 Tax=Rhabditophanes sp. KR3021 TaxID=114890 RepID=A0AC35TQE0_9BILA
LTNHSDYGPLSVKKYTIFPAETCGSVGMRFLIIASTASTVLKAADDEKGRNHRNYAVFPRKRILCQ